MTDRCTKQMTDKWKNRLSGLDIFLDDNCAAMLEFEDGLNPSPYTTKSLL
ncbi:MAG TPA: hypothetical protein VI278_11875 [Nitrososphaeraceae archaeon]